MARNEKQRKYFDSIVATVKKTSSASVVTGDSRSIHDFRVAVKKLRAVQSLNRASGKAGRFNKKWKALKKLYRLAGKVRDADIAIDLLNRMKEGTTRMVSRRKRARQLAFLRFKKAYPVLRRQADEELLKASRKMKKQKRSDVRAFVQKIARDVSKDMKQPTRTIEELHDARKKMKVIHYLRALINTKSKGMEKLFAAVDRVQEEIGNYHDLAMITPLIKRSKNRSLQKKVQMLSRSQEQKARKAITQFLKEEP